MLGEHFQEPPYCILRKESLGRLCRESVGEEKEGGDSIPVKKQLVQDPEGRRNTACPRLGECTVAAVHKE